MAEIAVAGAAGMRYPDWFRAQVVQAVLLHGLTNARAARLYGVNDDAVRKWVNAAEDTPGGLDRLDALEHRIARIEHYLALAQEIWHWGRDAIWHPFPAMRSNGHDAIGAVDGRCASVAIPPEGGEGQKHG
jgi:hypothetical protein